MPPFPLARYSTPLWTPLANPWPALAGGPQLAPNFFFGTNNVNVNSQQQLQQDDGEEGQVLVAFEATETTVIEFPDEFFGASSFSESQVDTPPVVLEAIKTTVVEFPNEFFAAPSLPESQVDDLAIVFETIETTVAEFPGGFLAAPSLPEPQVDNLPIATEAVETCLVEFTDELFSAPSLLESQVDAPPVTKTLPSIPSSATSTEESEAEAGVAELRKRQPAPKPGCYPLHPPSPDARLGNHRN